MRIGSSIGRARKAFPSASSSEQILESAHETKFGGIHAWPGTCPYHHGDRLREHPLLLIFTVTLFLGSALVFLIQPMFAKMALPLLGGSPSVWITSMLFFQAALLAGYAYAHFSTSRLGTRRQAAVHMVLLLVPLVALPIAVREGWAPPPGGSQVLWLLALLAVSVGPPFFVVSSTAPLLQRWFADTGHARAKDPYFLYRASNFGSAVALLGYPALVEPALRLADQGRLWAVGYGALLVLMAACALTLWRSPAATSTARKPATSPLREDPPPIAGGSLDALTVARRAQWVVLSFVPSSLMLGVTVFLTTDIAPIPLLWVVPLALYLLTFVLAFSPRPPLPQRVMVRAMPLLVIPLVVTILLRAARPPWLLIPLHLLAFFTVGMVCHGRLAQDRPPASRLTDFYLWIAVGGVLGGAFNAIVAPVVFNGFTEYPLAIVLACLLRPGRGGERRERRSRLLDLALPVALGAAVLGLAWWVRAGGVSDELLRRALVFGVPAFLCFTLIDRPVRLGLGLGAILVAGAVAVGAANPVVFADRSFFGAFQVTADAEGRFHLLTHGTTVHGAQSLDPARRDEPLTYYTRSGPLGQVFEAVNATGADDIAVVGLGAGSMACYARPGERWTFYEIDPLVERIARDPSLFTFLRDCLDRPRIVLGDARLSLERAADGQYDLIVVDAFNSDAIPVHLITREAIGLYLAKLADGGVLAFHISNLYLDLHPVLRDLARDAGLVSFARDDSLVTEADRRAGKSPSDWIVLARSPADVGDIVDNPRWYELKGQGGTLWTDDFSNILGVFRWS